MFKPSLAFNLGQQLSITPQLQQAIRLLQLSSLELQAEIQEALESNPMLEEVNEESPTTQEELESALYTDFETTTTVLSEPAADSHLSLDSALHTEHIPEVLALDTNWQDIYQNSFSDLPEDDRPTSDLSTSQKPHENLQEQLLWQLNLTPLSANDHLIGQILIDCIDQNGYLKESLEELTEAFPPELQIDKDEIEAVLHRIQQFEPIGCGARTLSECLLIQLRQLPVETPWRTQAEQLVHSHLEPLAKRDFHKLMRHLKVPAEDLKAVIRLVQSLDPQPGAKTTSTEFEYVVPDILVRKQGHYWVVELNQESLPKLRLNKEYTQFINRSDTSADHHYLRTQLQEARWLLKSLRSRNETILKVAKEIVAKQHAFFEKGEAAMKPLVLYDIAIAIGAHESTISRATTQKFMHTPRGTYELKYFFSSHVGTKAGQDCSATAVRAMIRQMISTENPKKPLSDNIIASTLALQGIQIARRTIAKYRESLGIATSSERKHLI